MNNTLKPKDYLLLSILSGKASQENVNRISNSLSETNANEIQERLDRITEYIEKIGEMKELEKKLNNEDFTIIQKLAAKNTPKRPLSLNSPTSTISELSPIPLISTRSETGFGADGGKRKTRKRRSKARRRI